MSGSMRGKSNDTIALIQRLMQQIERVQVGSYLGMNQGRN